MLSLAYFGDTRIAKEGLGEILLKTSLFAPKIRIEIKQYTVFNKKMCFITSKISDTKKGGKY